LLAVSYIIPLPGRGVTCMLPVRDN